MTAQQTKGLAWLALAILAGALWAVGLPFLARLVPWPVETRAARYINTERDVCAAPRNPQAALLFKTVTQRIFPAYPSDASTPLTIEVIHGPTVNAFASLGGHIYVYDGLLKQAESADELAGILAHEIEHVRRRHILEGVLVQLSTLEALQLLFTGGAHVGADVARILLNLRFSRDQEREADEGGLKRLRDTHVDAAGYVHFFERLQRMSSVPTLLSDHPSHEDRAALARRYETPTAQPILTPAEWTVAQTVCQ